LSPDLTISIVLFRTPIALLNRTLAALLDAVAFAVAQGEVHKVGVTLIDNGAATRRGPEVQSDESTKHHEHLHHEAYPSPLSTEYSQLTLPTHPNLTISWCTGHGNIGYGAANNLALLSSAAPFHLVLNPDVEITSDGLSNGLRCLRSEPNVVLVSPVAQSPDGQPLYLAKRRPSFGVLFLRGFAPTWALKALPASLKKRLDSYEYREIEYDARLNNLQITSGAFMLLRQSAVKSLQPQGFDARYFLYFEDFDLSLRLAKIGNVVREPNCKIIHAGGGAGKKGIKHIAYFIASGMRFFYQHRSSRS
jgi:GT2 family glycosyltransferase